MSSLYVDIFIYHLVYIDIKYIKRGCTSRRLRASCSAVPQRVQSIFLPEEEDAREESIEHTKRSPVLTRFPTVVTLPVYCEN